jgi:hypothetical protein
MGKTSANIFSGSRMREVCATCQFWDCDSREIAYSGRKQQNILVDGGYFRDCKCSIARTSRVAQLNSSCPNWKKWVNLD